MSSDCTHSNIWTAPKQNNLIDNNFSLSKRNKIERRRKICIYAWVKKLYLNLNILHIFSDKGVDPPPPPLSGHVQCTYTNVVWVITEDFMFWNKLYLVLFSYLLHLCIIEWNAVAVSYDVFHKVLPKILKFPRYIIFSLLSYLNLCCWYLLFFRFLGKRTKKLF